MSFFKSIKKSREKLKRQKENKSKKNVENNLSKSQIESVKDKVREEMKDAINKDKFISDEDAKLINKFLEKISSDLNKNSK